jgi:hypothetical protein
MFLLHVPLLDTPENRGNVLIDIIIDTPAIPLRMIPEVKRRLPPTSKLRYPDIKYRSVIRSWLREKCSKAVPFPFRASGFAEVTAVLIRSKAMTENHRKSNNVVILR